MADPETAAMLIDRDVALAMDDGAVLRADVYRPAAAAPVPVIMTLGPYGKGLRYQEGYAASWRWLVEAHPEVLDGSRGDFMVWETVDPERWVPAGYAVVRVDSRGSGRSPGLLDSFSPRETRDFYQAIEWAGVQPWSNGRVGLCGISYYAINQWLVAALRPPHLAAIVPWEGAADFYRDFTHHGGILSNAFTASWYPRRVLTMQHGRGAEGPTDPWLGQPAAGPETLTETELRANRVDFAGGARRHPLDDEFHRARSADLARIEVPLLSAGNWGGFGLHQRGNLEGFTQAGSRQKWLEMHGGHHEERFYLPQGRDLQRRFLDHFLKGEDNGWEREPRVWLNVRHADGRVVLRKEDDWPLARTRWTRLYLDASGPVLDWAEPQVPGQVAFAAMGEPLTLLSAPLAGETEITGPVAARLCVASSTADADLFLTFRAFAPDGHEVDFPGANDPHAPLSQGWLRASHRRLDPERSLPYRPYHAHDEAQPLVPGQVYGLDVELWATCVVLPAGSRLALTVGGRDFERPAGPGGEPSGLRGSGPFLHDDPDDRPVDVYGGVSTLFSGGQQASYLLLPLVPGSPV